MKRTSIAVAVLAAVLTAQPLAAAAQATAAPKPHAGMQMDPKMQQQMIDRMKTMQAQMGQIRQTSDPKEREKLLAGHMKSMQEGMQMMGGMSGGMMGMMGGGMMGGGQGGSAGQSAEMMERRMDMMQMMMEQMLQHQQMMQQAPAK